MVEQLEEKKYLQEQLLKQEAVKRQIQQALNEQTFEQFKQYAEQQYPGILKLLFTFFNISLYYF